ncbi:MAG TPA: neutral zinc metallopeptidase [Acidimicrobiales bacterium]|nr:neutral zinc metallopeptidase [Acidimicrobiales bacterium]
MKWRPTESTRYRRRGGGRGGMALPVTAGGGVIGLLVLLASVLLGGGGGEGGGGLGGLGDVLQDDLGAPGPETEQDRFVEFLAEDTQAVWADIFTEQGRTYEYATVNSFSGQVGTGCGAATSAVGPFYCPADRQVYLDLDFFDDLAGRFDAPGDFAQAYVVAHEVGHHVQNLLGTSAEVHAREQAAGSEEEANAWSVKLELQADCYAGVWAHSVYERGQESGSDVALEDGDIEEGLAAAAGVGDDRIQSQAGVEVDPETWTHGSSAQRQEWFTRGYESGDPADCDTFA